MYPGSRGQFLEYLEWNNRAYGLIKRFRLAVAVWPRTSRKKPSGTEFSELKLKRSLRAAHIPQKGHNDIFRFSFFPSTITEWNKLPIEAVTTQSLCIIKSKLL